MGALIFDAIAISGLVLLGVGLWLVHPSLSLCVLGVLFIVIGLAGAKVWVSSRRSGSAAASEPPAQS